MLPDFILGWKKDTARTNKCCFLAFDYHFQHVSSEQMTLVLVNVGPIDCAFVPYSLYVYLRFRFHGNQDIDSFLLFETKGIAL